MLKRNIIALYLIKIAKWFSLVMPVIVLFYEENDLSLQDVFILKSVYSFTLVLLDIPTGYIADSWGRRNSLIVGSFLTFGSYLCYSFSYSFAAFFMAEIILGIGQSMISGADSALLYDTMVYRKRESEYLKYEGRVTMVGNFSEAIAGIISGFLAVYSLRLPFYCQSIVSFVGIPAAFMIKEINIQTRISHPFSHILGIIRYSLITNKMLCCDILFSAIIGLGTLTMAWFIQPLLMSIDVPTEAFGVIWTVLNLTVGFSAIFSDRLNRKLGQKRICFLIVILISIGYVAISLPESYISLALLFLFYVVRGFATPMLKGYINQTTGSEMRATVLSIRNFIIRLLFAIVAPIAGWLCDAYSLSFALQIIAAIIFFPGILILLVQNRLMKRK